MTIQEYLDREAFPLSNGLTSRGSPRGLCEQIYADASRHDIYEESPPAAGTADAALYAELKRKVAAWEDLTFGAEMTADAQRRGISVGWGVIAGLGGG